jgi:uncharacterized protein YdeI (YjbR/CyaY-like superfamily)
MNRMNSKVDFFFNKTSKWQKEYEKLREIAIGCDLSEVLKWGCPCSTFNDYCAFLFFKGALMKDSKKILIQQTENVQSARQIRFTSLLQITRLEKVLRTYIYNAVEIEEKGLKVDFKKPTEFKIAKEFQAKLNNVSGLKKAFESLSPGRQRGYLLYFYSAKQSKTREERVEKYLKHILKGKGLED